MRTGDDVLVSAAMRTASFVRNPWLVLPNTPKAVCRRLLTIEGSQKCSGLEISPGEYELSGRS